MERGRERRTEKGKKGGRERETDLDSSYMDEGNIRDQVPGPFPQLSALFCIPSPSCLNKNVTVFRRGFSPQKQKYLLSHTSFT
jgi:hypothetical protein